MLKRTCKSWNVECWKQLLDAVNQTLKVNNLMLKDLKLHVEKRILKIEILKVEKRMIHVKKKRMLDIEFKCSILKSNVWKYKFSKKKKNCRNKIDSWVETPVYII